MSFKNILYSTSYYSASEAYDTSRQQNSQYTMRNADADVRTPQLDEEKAICGQKQTGRG